MACFRLTVDGLMLFFVITLVTTTTAHFDKVNVGYVRQKPQGRDINQHNMQ